ncbi:ATP-dependent Clp protease proteolytic subunit [Saccharopolyspora elongata]|uniref:ATP-dependent Clp protease proteolytic subunit n=2 Tax=Saccharopolyspora elongata TaxID=2530387 RepID=A0A4R4Y9T9_9PSEU|nr:ATP-dependent Clp protease proteolytic subunit [Saccharopolyspora elongata]
MPIHSWAMNKLMSDMFDDRTVVISGELSRNTSTAAISQLLLLNATDPDAEIKLYIDSATGSLPAGFAICDAINCIKPEVSTWAIGTVGSAATLVLCSGAIGKRYMLPGSHVVLRQPDHDEGLDGEPVTPTTADHQKWSDEMVQLLVAKTGQDPDIIARDLRNHLRLSTTDAAPYGIADQVMADGKYAPQGN